MISRNFCISIVNCHHHSISSIRCSRADLIFLSILLSYVIHHIYTFMYPPPVQERIDRIEELHRLVDQRDGRILKDEPFALAVVAEIRCLYSELLHFSSSTDERSSQTFLNSDIAERLTSLRRKIAEATGEQINKQPEVQFPENQILADQYFAFLTGLPGRDPSTFKRIRRLIACAQISLPELLQGSRNLKKWKVPGITTYTLQILRALLKKGPKEAEKLYYERPLSHQRSSDTRLHGNQLYQSRAKRIHQDKIDRSVDG